MTGRLSPDPGIRRTGSFCCANAGTAAVRGSTESSARKSRRVVGVMCRSLTKGRPEGRPLPVRSLRVKCVGLFVRVIGRAHQRSRFYVHKPLAERDALQRGEFVRMIVTRHARMLLRW